jgi:hypothetical protein
MNFKYKLSVLIISFMLILTFSAANAEGLSLQEANEEIARLEKINLSLKVRLKYFESEIAAYREKLASYDSKDTNEENEG